MDSFSWRNWKNHNIFQTIRFNHNKKQSCFISITWHYCMINFGTKKKKSYIIILKISSYLFKHFYFFHFISTQFIDNASLNIQMQITFAKSFNVFNNAAYTESQTKIWLVNGFIKKYYYLKILLRWVNFLLEWRDW